MTLAAHERIRLRGLWLRLAAATTTLDPEAMRAVSSDVLGLQSPLDGKAEAFTLFAFGRLAFAYVRGGAAYRLKAGEALRTLGQLAEALLYDAAQPPTSPPPPMLPFRTDING